MFFLYIYHGAECKSGTMYKVKNLSQYMSLSGGRMVRVPGGLTYVPPLHALSRFETCHGLMPMKCLRLWQKYETQDTTMLSACFEYEQRYIC